MPDLNIHSLESSPLIIAQSQEKDVQSSHIAERIGRAFNRALTFLTTIFASIRNTFFGSSNSNVEKETLSGKVTNGADLQQPLIEKVNNSSGILNPSSKDQRIQKGKEVAKELGINPNVIDIPVENASEKEKLEQNIIEWCLKKVDNSEYHQRIEAGKKILDCYLKGTSSLELENCQLTSLPENLNLPRLTHFNLSFNQLTSLPENLNLPSLTHFNLFKNEIKSLPENLNLPSLMDFGLMANKLVSLPDNLNLPSLTTFDLMGNKLTSLPENLNLPNLTNLTLSCNRLAALPENLNLPNLTSLSISSNQLAALPENLNFPRLNFLSLDDNKFALLPENLNLPRLYCLSLERNQNLQELPMSLTNCNNLSIINVENTQIPQEMVNQILQTCQHNRDLEVEMRLPNLLDLWSVYAEGDQKALAFLLELPKDERRTIAEWLMRLSKTKDFRGNQKELAKAVYAMLIDFSDTGLRTDLLGQMGSNNEGCQDRAAMAFNELFVAWKIWGIQKSVDQGKAKKEIFQLLGAAGRTLSLRKILSQMPQMQNQGEGVEIYLYYETELRDTLALLTAIRGAAYADTVGKRDWINEKELIQKVNEQHLDEVLALPVFGQLFDKDKKANEELEKLQSGYYEIWESVEEALQGGLTEGDYTWAGQKIKKNREKATNDFKKTWFLEQVK